MTARVQGQDRYEGMIGWIKLMAFFLVSVAAFVAVLLFKVDVQGKIIDLGYKITKENTRKKTLMQEKRQLVLEIQYLKSPARINDVLEEQFPMKPPAGEQIVKLKSDRKK